MALRLTSRPILDIALQYRFDSQQTFTRAFKKQFDRTQPYIAVSMSGVLLVFVPPIKLDPQPCLNGNMCNTGDKLIGIEQNFVAIPEQWANACSDMRPTFWQNYITKVNIIPMRFMVCTIRNK